MSNTPIQNTARARLNQAHLKDLPKKTRDNLRNVAIIAHVDTAKQRSLTRCCGNPVHSLLTRSKKKAKTA